MAPYLRSSTPFWKKRGEERGEIYKKGGNDTDRNTENPANLYRQNTDTEKTAGNTAVYNSNYFTYYKNSMGQFMEHNTSSPPAPTTDNWVSLKLSRHPFSRSIGHPPHSSASPVELRLREGPRALSGKKKELR
jgi:hypothetical protein